MLYIVSEAVVTLIAIASCSHANVLLGPPNAEQVRVTLSPVLAVVFRGLTETVCSGDTARERET